MVRLEDGPLDGRYEKTDSTFEPVPSSARSSSSSSKSARWPWLLLLGVLATIALRSSDHLGCSGKAHSAELLKAAKCPAQPSARDQGPHWDILRDSEYADLAAKRLSKAVQHNTESFDFQIPVPADDPSFDKHYAFANFLYGEYPKLFSGGDGEEAVVKHEVINTHGQLLTWQGSNKDLQPIVLMAHLDTVPVLKATEGQWRYPPFEGSITVDGTADTSGTWIWGRGSSDCKNSLMGIYGAMERLIGEGFVPERTIIVASGFDEEIGGWHGAGPLAKAIEERYGQDSVAFIVDEGFTGITYEHGATVASLGMAEKGAVNVQITVNTLGGHSSVPPPHTGIGYMSLLLAELESHPYTPSLDPAAPYLKYLTCMADLAPSFPHKLKKQIKDPKKWDALAREMARSDPKLNAFLATTQATDLIQGGVKVNALPEVVTATINHRISFTSSVNETLNHIISLLNPLAAKLNFTLSSWDDDESSAKLSAAKSTKHITLAYNAELEPAPITPSDGKSFELMAGTTKAVFGHDTIVSPSGMFANTDTRHFWNLTKNLYRFTPAVVVENLNQHTVDERISLAGHLNTTLWFYKLIQNSNGWDAK